MGTPEQHAGPDTLADEALACLCGEMDFTTIERETLARVLRGLARRVALEAVVRTALDARCSSQAAEEAAEPLGPAKRAAADAADAAAGGR